MNVSLRVRFTATERREKDAARLASRRRILPARRSLSVRERQVDVLNLHRRQLIEAALICLEAIGRTEAHSKVAMKNQAK